MIIDTHVHLNDEKYINDLDQIINEAVEHNVKKMICIGYDKESSFRALKIAEKYPNVYATIGIHPSEVNKLDEDNLNWLKENLYHPKVVAVGEIGLDYYWDKSYKEKQIEYFKKQLEIARINNLPVVIHSRNATNETYECLQNSHVVGVMHCYSGSLEMAKRFINIGFYLGIGGVLTFKNSNLKEVVESISIDYLLSETDGPYLTPEPYRGRTNYPKYTEIIVKKIAEVKDLDLAFVKAKLYENATKLFMNMKEVIL